MGSTRLARATTTTAKSDDGEHFLNHPTLQIYHEKT